MKRVLVLGGVTEALAKPVQPKPKAAAVALPELF